MKRKILTPDELSAALKTLDGWTAGAVIAGRFTPLLPEEGWPEAGGVGGDGVPGLTFLKKRFAFPNFAAALDLVNRVGALAEAADHHPDITFGWGYAEIALTTHDRGGITDVDIALATKIDAIP